MAEMTEKKRKGQYLSSKGKFGFEDIVRLACETTYSDFAYLALTQEKNPSKYEISASYGMQGIPHLFRRSQRQRLGIDTKLISAGPLLSASSSTSYICISQPYTDPRLAKNRIVSINSSLTILVSGQNIHVQPSQHEFRIEHYTEFRVGGVGSLILLDKEADIVRTDRQLRHVHAVCELVEREIMMERKLVGMLENRMVRSLQSLAMMASIEDTRGDVKEPAPAPRKPAAGTCDAAVQTADRVASSDADTSDSGRAQQDAGGKDEEDTAAVDDELDEENRRVCVCTRGHLTHALQLFEMLNAMADGNVDMPEESINFIKLAATKRGFGGSNAALLASTDLLASEPASSPYNGKVLVIEDDTTRQKRLWKLMEKLSIDFFMVSSSSDAIKTISSDGGYSLVICPCRMVEDTLSIKLASSDAKMKIVAVAEEGEQDRKPTQGIDEVIKSPLTMSRLKEALEVWEMERIIA